MRSTTRGTLDQCDHNECDTVCTMDPRVAPPEYGLIEVDIGLDDLDCGYELDKALGEVQGE